MVVAAAMVGRLAWSGHALTLPFAILFPAFWAAAPTRPAAALVSVAYFLAAARGLPQGIAAFFGSTVWAGFLLTSVASLSFVSVHAFLWTPRPGLARALRYGLAATLMALPPFGITGWAHPITGAGVLFPGWGWWGLAATSLLLVTMTTRMWSIVTLIAAAAWLWSVAAWAPPAIPTDWVGVDTEAGAALGTTGSFDQHRRLLAAARERAAGKARVVIFPETTLGALTPTVERYWTDGLAPSGVTVIAGAVVIVPQGYDNVLVAIGEAGAATIYRQRMPVPVSMWQPWRSWFGGTGSARATFFGEPVVTVGGRRVAPLICYEQLIIWPVLQSALHHPDTLLAVGNGWWAAGTSIPAIQHASAEAWARLFGLSLVTAFNS